jgi:hypothetical protein
MRHHYVSVLGARGFDVTRIAERIGGTKQVVINTCLHMLPGLDDEAADPIDAAWAEADDRDKDVGDSWGKLHCGASDLRNRA